MIILFGTGADQHLSDRGGTRALATGVWVIGATGNSPPTLARRSYANMYWAADILQTYPQ